ncbi:hypothetical protein ACTWQF_13460 [Streptomyces sp. 8N114]|uniref:hypothetical protein n=1 Tax=Streptomyces sp. 8N114 TaxID=3457419 RepID=UPI003FD6BBB9
MRHQIETAELADTELDAVSGGVLAEHVGDAASTIGGVEGLVASTVPGVSTQAVPSSGASFSAGASASA